MLILEAINASARLSWAWEVLSSPLAQRVEVLAIGAAVIFVSLRAALRADSRARKRIEFVRNYYRGIVKGRAAYVETTVKRQRDRILRVAPRLRRSARRSLRHSVIAGVAVPAGLLMLAVMFYGWLDPAGGHLLDSELRPMTHPSPIDAAIFVADQTFRGGLFDVLEVFSVEITPLTNNPSSRLFSAGVVAHHLFVEAFIFSGLLLFLHSLWKIRKLEKETLDWFEKRTRNAQEGAKAKAAAKAEAPDQLPATH